MEFELKYDNELEKYRASIGSISGFGKTQEEAFFKLCLAFLGSSIPLVHYTEDGKCPCCGAELEE